MHLSEIWHSKKNDCRLSRTQVISRADIKDFKWEKETFRFTRPTVEQWNESNTVKYDGHTVGEFQVHSHRSSFKFRFHLANLLALIHK